MGLGFCVGMGCFVMGWVVGCFMGRVVVGCCFGVFVILCFFFVEEIFLKDEFV